MMTKTLLGRTHERMGEELHDATTTPPDNLWERLGRDPRQMAKEDTDVADVKTAKKIKSALDNKEPPNYGLDSHWEKLAKDEADAKKKLAKDQTNDDFFKALHEAGNTKKAATLDQALSMDEEKPDSDDEFRSTLFGGQASHPETLALMEADSQQAAETQVGFPQDSLAGHEESQVI